MTLLRALFDVVVYRTEAGDTTSFEKGEIADVPDDQVARLLDIDAAEKAGKAEKPPTTEKAVADMTVRELKAFAKKNELVLDPKVKRRDALVGAIDKALTLAAAGTPPAEPTTPAGDGQTDQDAGGSPPAG